MDNKVEILMIKTTQVVLLDSEDPSTKKKEDSSPRKYIPKAHFPLRLAKTKNKFPHVRLWKFLNK